MCRRTNSRGSKFRAGSTVLLHLSRVRSTVLRCLSRAVRLRHRSLVRPRGLVMLRRLSRAARLRDRSLVRPRGLVMLRRLSSMLRVGNMVLRRGLVMLRRLSRVVRLPVGSMVLRWGRVMLPLLSRAVRLRHRSLLRPRGLVMLRRLSRVARLPAASTVLRRGLVMLRRLSSRLPPLRATPQNRSRRKTLTRPWIAMPSPSRRLILSLVPPRLLGLTVLAFLNRIRRRSRSSAHRRPTPLLIQQGSLPLSRRRCLPPTR